MNAFNFFCDEMGKRTEGRVKVTLYPAGALAPPPEAFNACVKGVADISESVAGFTAGAFPGTQVGELPLGMPSSWVSSNVMNDWYNNFKPKEYDQVVVLFLSAQPPPWIATVNKPVRSLEDLKGLTIRTSGAVDAKTLEALGAIPRPMPVTEIYEALSKGVIEGVAISVEAFPAFKLHEVIKYSTDITKIDWATPGYLVMNRDSWGKLSSQDQKTLSAVAKETFNMRAKAQDGDLAGAMKMFTGLPGREVIKLSPAEMAKWEAKVSVVIDDWVSGVTAKGLPGADYVKYAKERIDYWSKQKP
ncbi:TRAP transporter substrate-binding protein [Chloroflexota bacterium]